MTQGQWKAVMETNPSNYLGNHNPGVRFDAGDVLGFLAATRLRLPTETQWEYACRESNATPFASTGGLDIVGPRFQDRVRVILNGGWVDGNGCLAVRYMEFPRCGNSFLGFRPAYPAP